MSQSRLSVAALACLLTLGQASAKAAPALQIYFIDVEGGGATLVISPTGESMLIDSGNAPPNAERDTKRIYAAMQLAGLKKLDYLFITHYDTDHAGGVATLAKMTTIDKFVDHGDMDNAWFQNPNYDERWKNYLAASSGKRMIVKPGDMVHLKGVRVQVVSANGEFCEAHQWRRINPTAILPSRRSPTRVRIRVPPASCSLWQVQVPRRRRSDLGQRNGAGMPRE